MEHVNPIFTFIVKVVVWSILLFVAMKITKREDRFVHLFLASLIAGLLGLIPIIGIFLSFITLLLLISKWTTAEIWPDGLLIVIVAWGLGMLAILGLVASLYAGY